MSEHKDFTGEEIKIGSKVAVAMQSYQGEMRLGVVEEFREKTSQRASGVRKLTEVKIEWTLDSHGWMPQAKSTWITLGSRATILVIGASR